MATQAKFIQGSILKHVITMTSTNAIGLSALFMVDLINIFFISSLGHSAFTAAIGYASALLFFSTSLSIGLVTVNSAIISKLIGQHKYQQARQSVSHLSIYALLLSASISLLIWLLAPSLLTLIGARGEELQCATQYIRIIIPSLPILALAMQMGATLRSLGNAKHAMYVTLGGGLINALLDPIFIFVLHLDLRGAAIATVIARIATLTLGLYFLIKKYDMLAMPHFRRFKKEIKHITAIALPAMLTQIATPLGNIYVTYEVARFGSKYVAGWAIIGRLIPVAFSLLFALSGAIGPIIGQNFGAGNFLRVRETFIQSLRLTVAYTSCIAILLALGQETIISIFHAQHESAEIIQIFCQYIGITFIFTGFTFVCMAFLNNLGYAKYATLLNVGKMTLGTVPFVSLGAFYFDAPGILYGQALGSIIFGLLALCLTYTILNISEQKTKGIH